MYINSILGEKVMNCHFETRKDYAAVVSQTKYPAFFFSYYDKKVTSPLEWLWTFPNDKVSSLLNKLGEQI